MGSNGIRRGRHGEARSGRVGTAWRGRRGRRGSDKHGMARIGGVRQASAGANKNPGATS
jgi:hypothetical protein